MKKESICVYIENEAQYIEARRLLNKFGEYTNRIFDDGLSKIKRQNYLQLGNPKDRMKGWWLASVYKDDKFTKITLSELEVILMKESQSSLLKMLKRANVALKDCALLIQDSEIFDLVEEIKVLIEKNESK